jgi:hypothetical protein
MVTTEQVEQAASTSVGIVSSDGKRVYAVELFVDGSASCTCMAYRFQKGPRANATCKHIRQAGGGAVLADATKLSRELRVAGISFRKAIGAPVMGWSVGR